MMLRLPAVAVCLSDILLTGPSMLLSRLAAVFPTRANRGSIRCRRSLTRPTLELISILFVPTVMWQPALITACKDHSGEVSNLVSPDEETRLLSIFRRGLYSSFRSGDALRPAMLESGVLPSLAEDSMRCLFP